MTSAPGTGSRRLDAVRRAAEHVTVSRPPRRGHARAHPAYLLYGFLVLIAFGTFLLLLPAATRGEGGTSFMTALFTSTSAVCVTGLVVVDTHDYWSPFGQAVILLLVHLGGFGFMTSASLLFVLAGRRISMRYRLLAGDTLGRAGTSDLARLVGRIAVMTLVIEAAGAVVLLALFARDGFAWYDVWHAVFTAISAFNNAGFDLEGGFRSLIGSRGDVPLLSAVMALVALGGFGYAVIADALARRRWRRLAVETKIVLAASAVLWIAGAAVFFILERGAGGSLEGSSFGTSLTNSLAMSVFARSAGFTVVELAVLGQATLFMVSGLIFIGGASASTAGGIKLSTFGALLAAAGAALRGHEHVTVFEREISTGQVYRALTVALLSVGLVSTMAFALAILHDADFIDLFLETVSAFGTAGLTTGITPGLSAAAQLLLIVGMYVGRLGPLTIALALLARAEPEQYRYPSEVISIG